MRQEIPISISGIGRTAARQYWHVGVLEENGRADAVFGLIALRALRKCKPRAR